MYLNYIVVKWVMDIIMTIAHEIYCRLFVLRYFVEFNI